MKLVEALLITLLGMGAVFFGLLLTSLAIHLFGLLLMRRKEKGTSLKKSLNAVKPEIKELPPVEIVAAILTTLELEKKINLSYRTSRFTFKPQKGR